MVSSCEYGSVPSVSIKGKEFHGQLRDYQFFKKDPAAWTWSVLIYSTTSLLMNRNNITKRLGVVVTTSLLTWEVYGSNMGSWCRIPFIQVHEGAMPQEGNGRPIRPTDC
jgi:hypothetical protein